MIVLHKPIRMFPDLLQCFTVLLNFIKQLKSYSIIIVMIPSQLFVLTDFSAWASCQTNNQVASDVRRLTVYVTSL